MASLNTILTWFKKGLIPTERQFAQAWSSFRHKDDKIPFGEVDGLSEAFGETASAEVISTITEDLNTRAKADASNIDVVSWKEALEITNIATVDGDNLDGNVYNKTQIDEIVTILHERDDTNAQLIDDVKQQIEDLDVDVELTSMDESLIIDDNNIQSNISMLSEEFETVVGDLVVLSFPAIQIIGVFDSGIKLNSTQYNLDTTQRITLIAPRVGDYIEVLYTHLKTDL